MSDAQQLQANLSSRHVCPSATSPGVELVIGNMTFGRRIELMRMIRDLAARLEYFQAGQDADNRMEASLLGAEIDRVYVEWGLEEVRGLTIDGEAATPRSLIDRGPEPLFFEALAAIKAECGLNETEKKKLILAFHFQFANRAGWDCESCRKHGLEVKRRCGFIAAEKRGSPRVVWARKEASSEECPKSAITGASLSLVEDFFVRRRLGFRAVSDTEARQVDAFLILQNEMEREERDVATTQH